MGGKRSQIKPAKLAEQSLQHAAVVAFLLFYQLGANCLNFTSVLRITKQGQKQLRSQSLAPKFGKYTWSPRKSGSREFRLLFFAFERFGEPERRYTSAPRTVRLLWMRNGLPAFYRGWGPWSVGLKARHNGQRFLKQL